MSRYHFHVSDGHVVAYDHEGTTFATAEEARAEAVQSARHLMSQSNERGFCRRHWQFEVADDAGDIIFTLPFAHALHPDRLRALLACDLD